MKNNVCGYNCPSEIDSLTFVKHLLESARSLMLREHCFMARSIDPTTEIELSFSEIESLIQLLTEKE